MWFHTIFSTIAYLVIWPWDPQPPRPSLPGTFVRYQDIHTCPRLAPRLIPRTAKDVRPDDFSVIMAIGDSITAGLLARPSAHPDALNESTLSSRLGPIISLPSTISEYRGLSYPIGSDPNAITLPNIISHFSPHNLTGSSTGKHVPMGCALGYCGHGEGDGLNAAISGSTSPNLFGQVKDYLIPMLEGMEVDREAWKYLNVGIGANDICAFCLTPNITASPFTGSPEAFARGIKDAVELLRKHVPHVIVNIIGLFRVSTIYKLTLKDPYCSGPLIPPILPHLPLECSCALLPGPAGDYTRSKMDELSEAYDEAVLSLIREWAKEDDPSFGAIWQPGSAIDLENWPIEALSPVDCFHPSELAHQRVAAGVWNRLTLPMELRGLPIGWTDDVWVRCLEEGDRIPV